jgi:hypothetical protein
VSPSELLLSDSETRDAGFIVLNWDTVLERFMLESHPTLGLQYGSGMTRALISAPGDAVAPEPSHAGELHITKMHGSLNW